MKRFLISVALLMVAVLALVVVLFFYVQTVLAPKPIVLEKSTQSATTSESVAPVTLTTTATTSGVSAKAAPAKADEQSIPLSSLPLSDSQKTLLKGAGIDVATFVITPEMVTCAKEKIGTARMDEIIAGASPSVLEMASLMRCL